jgi:hypothetical protein
MQVPVDIIMILAAATAAYFLRSLPALQGYVSKVFTLSFQDYIVAVMIMTPFIIGIFALEGLYVIRVTSDIWSEARKVIRGSTLALVVLIVTIFLNNGGLEFNSVYAHFWKNFSSRSPKVFGCKSWHRKAPNSSCWERFKDGAHYKIS